MSLTKGQQQLVDMALDRLDTLREQDRAPAEYVLDQLLYGGTPEYHGGARPERADATFLIELLRDRMRDLPHLRELSA